MDYSEQLHAARPAVDRRLVLLVASLAPFIGAVMNSSVNVAIPTMGHDFGVDAVTLTWISSGFLLAYAMAVVPFGKMADIYGRKKVFLAGVIVWTLASLLGALAVSAPMLIAARILQGLSVASLFVVSMALVTSVYPPEIRGRAMGLNVAAVYIGLALGPTLGGLMTDNLGWRSLFYMSVILSLAIIALTVARMPAEWAEASGQRLDLPGAAIFAVTLAFVMLGFARLPGTIGLVAIAAGIVLLAVFVWWEKRTHHPMLDIGLFRHNKVFALSNLAALINYSAVGAIVFLLSLYLQYVKGLDAQSAGLILLAEPVVMVVLSPLAGRLSDRIEPRIVSSIGMAVTALGIGLLAFTDDGSSLAYIVGALVVTGIGFGLFSSPNASAVMGCVDRARLGLASGTLGLMRAVGQMLSMGIATVIIAVYVGEVQVTPEYHDSFAAGFRLAFLIFAAMCVAAVFASAARGKVRQ